MVYIYVAVSTGSCVKGELKSEKQKRCPSGKGKREAMRSDIVVRRVCHAPLACGGNVGPGCRVVREGGGRISMDADAKAMRAGEREERASTSHDAWLRRFYACTACDLTPSQQY